VKRVPIRISGIISREISLFSDTKFDYDGSDALVLADDMLESVFDNLIGNAIKFGGTDILVIIRVTEGEREATVSIADHGPGIPDDLKSLVFGRFRRGEHSVSGKGLGLFICKALVERYGGKIWIGDPIEGDPGKGTVVRFTLEKP
jgi:signal transduction histidine kinase